MNAIKVHIQGTEYPFLYGRVATRMYARKKQLSNVDGKSLLSVLMGLSTDDEDLLNWCCFKVGCSAEEIEFPFTEEDFQKACDEDPKILIEIEKAIQASMPVEEKSQGNEEKPKTP